MKSKVDYRLRSWFKEGSAKAFSLHILMTLCAVSFGYEHLLHEKYQLNITLTLTSLLFYTMISSLWIVPDKLFELHF